MFRCFVNHHMIINKINIIYILREIFLNRQRITPGKSSSTLLSQTKGSLCKSTKIQKNKGVASKVKNFKKKCKGEAQSGLNEDKHHQEMSVTIPIGGCTLLSSNVQNLLVFNQNKPKRTNGEPESCDWRGQTPGPSRKLQFMKYYNPEEAK